MGLWGVCVCVCAHTCMPGSVSTHVTYLEVNGPSGVSVQERMSNGFSGFFCLSSHHRRPGITDMLICLYVSSGCSNTAPHDCRTNVYPLSICSIQPLISHYDSHLQNSFDVTVVLYFFLLDIHLLLKGVNIFFFIFFTRHLRVIVKSWLQHSMVSCTNWISSMGPGKEGLLLQSFDVISVWSMLFMEPLPAFQLFSAGVMLFPFCKGLGWATVFKDWTDYVTSLLIFKLETHP